MRSDKWPRDVFTSTDTSMPKRKSRTFPNQAVFPREKNPGLASGVRQINKFFFWLAQLNSSWPEILMLKTNRQGNGLN